MGDAIVISDDSDVEASSSSAAWRQPHPLEVNPGPSYGQGHTSAAAPTAGTAQLNLSLPVSSSLTSPASPDPGVRNTGAKPAPRPQRPLDLIDLTDDPGTISSTFSRPGSSVIDLTEKEEEQSVTEVVCAGPNVRRTLDVGTETLGPGGLGRLICSDFDLRTGIKLVPRRSRAVIKLKKRARVASDSESPHRPLPGSLSPRSSPSHSRNSPERAHSNDPSSLESHQQVSDVAAISPSSSSCSHVTTTTGPSMLENFYQVLLDSSEERASDDSKPEPIPEARVQVVINTIEASFPEATVQCLEEFVTPQYYPPREILSHLIRKILLRPDIGTLLNDTFKLLSKIQELHPASANQVEWDWELLASVMRDDRELPGTILFLRYVIKTLEDDFQEVLKYPLDQMPATIASSFLSCDKQPHNIKDIIKWLVETVSGPGFPPIDNFPLTAPRPRQAPALSPQSYAEQHGNQLVVLYLQKMLALAVEVDRTPTCTSNKIAEMLFVFVLNIPERNQREAFFISMENHLLRCKVLEILLLHSCDKPTTLPLSFAQILYFLNNATSLYNQAEDVKWDSWDELVEHLQFLLISYQRVLTEHLRVFVKERKEAAKKYKPQVQHGDDITALDVEQQIEGFRGRMVQIVGGTMPFHLQEKLFLLKLLFLQAIHGKPLLESRFQDGHLMKPHKLLDQEFPNF